VTEFEKDKLINQEYRELVHRFTSLSDFVYEAIRDAIVSGRISPGARLKQLDLARELGVSQQTVREALKRLVNSSLVMQQPNKGFTATYLPLQKQAEIYKMRAVLERFAAEEAAPGITEKDLQRMEEILPYTAAVDESLSNEVIRNMNHEFHLIPARATKNELLNRMLDQVWDLTLTYFYTTEEAKRKDAAKNDLKEHKQFLVALKAREGERAGQIIFEHITSVRGHWLEYVGSDEKKLPPRE
jgi:DNA-binding GntR family transcriptional regulator